MDLVQAPQNLPFSVALGFVVILAVLQVLALLVGGTIGGGGSHLDADLDLDVDTHFEVDVSHWAAALDWLGVGKMPLSILLSLWAAGFGFSGLALQAIIKSRSGDFLPPLLASAVALGLSLPFLKASSTILRPLLPRDETEAVAIETLLGSEGEIVVGCARRGRPTQARVRDKWGTPHYVLVEPENDGDEFPAGSQVLLLKRSDHIFRVIAGANVHIED